jgi:hypothetical protein
MRKNKSQLRVAAGAPLPAIKRTDASGKPIEIYRRGKMAAVWRKWRHRLSRLGEDSPDLTFTEMRIIEAWVRKELYP